MAGSPENTSGRKINILGKEIGAPEVGLAGFGMVALSVLAANQPCLTVPLLVAGAGMVYYSIRGMERK